MTDLHLPRAPIGRLRSLLLLCSGTNRAVLDKCPTEIEHRTGLGLAVLLPTLLATVGGGVALWNLGAGPIATVVGAAAVGLVVLVVDRLMVTTPIGPLSLVARVVMTVAMAWLIGEQLLLAAFNSEVEAELEVIAAEDADALVDEVTASTDAELARIDTRTTELTASDPQLVAASEELAAAEEALREARSALAGLRVELRAEIAGTDIGSTSGAAGDGPAADQIRAQIELADITVVEAEARRDSAAAVLEDTTTGTVDVSEELAALAEDRRQVEENRTQALAEIEADEAVDGVIARIEALERLGRSPAMAAQIWALRIFLFAVDTLPLTVKLAGARRRSPYDELMDAYRHVALQRADSIRTDRPNTPSGPPSADSTGSKPGRSRRPRSLTGGRLVDFEVPEAARTRKPEPVADGLPEPVQGRLPLAA